MVRGVDIDLVEAEELAGSDFHGEKVKPDVELAKWPLELEWFIDA